MVEYVSDASFELVAYRAGGGDVLAGGVAELPQPLTEQMIRVEDLILVLGREPHVDPVEGTSAEIWDTDEPSLRGIDGMPRMDLIRDDIAARADELAARLTQS